MKNRILAVVLVLASALVVTTAHAGDLAPPGAPASSMRTLEQLKPAWDQKIPVGQRFKLVMDDNAVLDKETGLVWERSPMTTKRYFLDGLQYCNNLSLGGRKGYRLPAIYELTSLFDMTSQAIPKLPANHPFQNILYDNYMSSSTYAFNNDDIWYADMKGDVNHYGTAIVQWVVWCVRGGR